MKYRYAAVAVLLAVGLVAVLAVYKTIAERKAESQYTVLRVVNIDEQTVDPAEWGKDYPRQYDTYKRTVDMERTRFGGSEADPFALGSENVRKTRSHIEQDPRLVKLWSGYAFSIDYREERGHAYMLHDQRETERVLKRPQPGSCVHCHASITVPYRKAGIDAGAPGKLTDPLFSDTGKTQLMKGFEIVSAEPFATAMERVTHPVACIDCHDPKSMQLRVTRPAFLNGIVVLAASTDGLAHFPSIVRWRKGDRKKPYDPNALASRQEMRSFVCGQCHVEYYCGPKTTLFYPWNNGLKIEQIEAYYNDYKFPDGSPFQIGSTGSPALMSSRHSIPNSRCGIKVFTRVRAWHAPIATCLISAKERLSSAITKSVAPCSTWLDRARFVIVMRSPKSRIAWPSFKTAPRDSWTEHSMRSSL